MADSELVPPPPPPFNAAAPGEDAPFRGRHLNTLAQLRHSSSSSELAQQLAPKSGGYRINLTKAFEGCECCGGEGEEDGDVEGQIDDDVAPTAAVEAEAEAQDVLFPIGFRRDSVERMLQAVRAKRELQVLKTKRAKSLMSLKVYQATKASLADCKRDDVKNHALKRVKPLEALPPLPTPLPPAPKPAINTIELNEEHASIRKVDFHQHCMYGDEEGLTSLMSINEAWGVARNVLLSLRFPKDSRSDVRLRNDWVLDAASRWPGLVPFVTIIEDDAQAPQMLRDYADRGAKGLKLIGWHSNYIKKFDYDLRLPSLVETFRVAAERRIPVLMHLWVGYQKTSRNYLEDLRAILKELPDLRIVLAHFGLGFDPQTLSGLLDLMEHHSNVYLDTSLYGAFMEIWFSRASNQAQPLRDVCLRFPRQILFGSDVFGSRRKRPQEYVDAIKASIGFLEQDVLQCAEFKKTEYFKNNKEDKYGSVVFDPMNLQGLGLGGNEALLRRIYFENAEDLLALACDG